MKNLIKAVLSVMNEVKGIDKSMTIGNGSSSYKGVPDKEVKKIIGESMHKNGLCMLPIEIEPTVRIDRWTEETQFGLKQKQSVFTEVKTKYLLCHESGENVVIAGYGHGIDSQDKGAGKATTYAGKYALLYTFLVATGKIDDADVTHSESIETPQLTPKIEMLNEVTYKKALSSDKKEAIKATIEKYSKDGFGINSEWKTNLENHLKTLK